MKHPIMKNLKPLTLLLCAFGAASLAHAFFLSGLNGPNPVWGFVNNVNLYHGHMYARGVYTNEEGDPVYVEYNEQGEEVSEIGAVAIGSEFENSVLMSPLEYNQYIEHYQQQLQSFIDFNGANTSLEPQLLSAQDYEQLLANLAVADGQTPATPWQGDADSHTLRASTRSVLVLPEELLLTPTTQFLLAEYPVDLTQNKIQLGANVRSLIIGFDGGIIKESEHRIAFRAIFFEDTEKDVSDEQRYNQSIFTYAQQGSEDELRLVAPITGVAITPGFAYQGGGVTNADGRYSMSVRGTPCPLFYYDNPLQLEAQLPYRAFNPDRPGLNYYYLTKQVYIQCQGYGPSSFVPVIASDFPVDVNILTGSFLFPNVELAGELDDPQLEYDFNTPEPNANGEAGERFRYTTFDQYDFDLDGQFDTAVCGSLNDDNAFIPLAAGENCAKSHVQGIYLSASSAAPNTCTDTDDDGVINPEDPQCQPQFTRLIDTVKVQQDIGLVRKMGQAHVQDTDLFIIRAATGELVVMRQGLKDDEKAYGPSRNDIAAAKDELKADFRMLMRGPKSHYARSFENSRLRDEEYGFNRWHQNSSMAPELQKLDEADHIRTGEQLELWAINRVTGYIGSATLTMTPEQISAGILDTLVPTIDMQPPNLKIWAERVYDIEAGLTQDETRRYLIGND